MRGKFGCAVVLLALAALVASESQSFGGHRRRARCGSCASGCATGSCSASGCTMPAAPAEASPSDAANATAPASPATIPDDVASPSDKGTAPAPSVAARPSTYNNYYTRRGRIRLRYRR